MSMPAKQVLIVEDERPIREMIAFGLKRHGFEVREAEDCRAARASLADRRPDLVLIDWMLPDMSGLELARSLKRDRETRELPIIMLTARAEEGDKVAGLEGGADDYVTKPFSPRELVARVHAVLRRTDPETEDDVLEAGDVVLDRRSRTATVDGSPVELTGREFDLIWHLAERPGIVVRRERILERVWGLAFPGGTRTVDVHVGQLRRKLDRPELIRTVRGAGYKLVP